MEREDIEPQVDRVIDEMQSGEREMGQRSDELDEQVEATRKEWRDRQADPQVPGAPPRDEGQDPSESTDQDRSGA
jgi:hypothetical protein